MRKADMAPAVAALLQPKLSCSGSKKTLKL
jgi:hypothetical protein